MDKPMQYEEDFTDDDFKNENLHPRARYTDCSYSQNQRISSIRFAFSEMYKCIDLICKNSRETSLAITKLEEAQFWAIKGITREENENGEQQT